MNSKKTVIDFGRLNTAKHNSEDFEMIYDDIKEFGKVQEQYKKMFNKEYKRWWRKEQINNNAREREINGQIDQIYDYIERSRRIDVPGTGVTVHTAQAPALLLSLMRKLDDQMRVAVIESLVRIQLMCGIPIFRKELRN